MTNQTTGTNIDNDKWFINQCNEATKYHQMVTILTRFQQGLCIYCGKHDKLRLLIMGDFYCDRCNRHGSQCEESLVQELLLILHTDFIEE